eukprot:gene24903-31297_t
MLVESVQQQRNKSTGIKKIWNTQYLYFSPEERSSRHQYSHQLCCQCIAAIDKCSSIASFRELFNERTTVSVHLPLTEDMSWVEFQEVNPNVSVRLEDHSLHQTVWT